MPRSMVTRGGPSFSAPRWAGDYMGRDNLLPYGAKLVAAAFPTDDDVVVTANGAAAVGDETMAVTALTGKLPFGTRLVFSGGAAAILTAEAEAGAVQLSIRPLVAGIADTETANYDGGGTRFVPSGTVVGRTLVERDAGTGFGPAADADDEIYLLAFDVADADEIDDAELYRPNNTVYENFLPNFAGLSAAVKAAVRAQYNCTINTPEA